jgi:hypothetical protein
MPVTLYGEKAGFTSAGAGAAAVVSAAFVSSFAGSLLQEESTAEAKRKVPIFKCFMMDYLGYD